MDKEQNIFDAAMEYDFEAVRIYAESGGNLNICNNQGCSLLACFVDSYYRHQELDAEEQSLYDIHDEYDYDFWDGYVFKFQRTPLEKRSDDIREKLDFFLDYGANPNLCILVDGMTETPLMHSVCRHDYYLTKYLLEHGADPGIWLSKKPEYEKRDQEYWLMDELDISIMNGDKDEAAGITLSVAQLLWEYGLRDWSGYCIDIDKDTGATGGHPMRVLF